MFINNCEFLATTLVGVGIMEHHQLYLALHLAHWMSINGIMHLQLNVIFRVCIPLKTYIQEKTKTIGLLA
jgi:hypothetical protein